jgi:hypothetical protein
MIFVSFPGVCTHELGHYFMARIFRHSIIKWRLFEYNPSSGSLGYVHHGYNENSIYQTVGNFFIGMAPLITGSLVIYLLVGYFFGSSSLNPFETNTVYNLEEANTVLVNYMTSFSFYESATKELFEKIWLYAMESPWKGMGILILMISIALHSSPSRSDLQGALSGGVSVTIVAFLVNTVALYFINCCEQSIISMWMTNLKVWIVYFEIVMINLICFTFALATIGLCVVFFVYSVLWMIQKVLVRKRYAD